jgi:predicted MFS family arabinose efflux permease
VTHGAGGKLPLGLLAAAGFLSSAGARVIGPLLPVIAGDFASTVPEVSIVVSAFTLPYGLCQLVLGPVGDRFGRLRVILASLLAYALATGACALAGDLPALTLLRVGAGAASAGLIGGTFVDYIGWRAVFLFLAGAALLVSTLFALRIRSLPDPFSRAAALDVAPYRALGRSPLSRRLLLGALLDGVLLVGCFPFLASFLRERFGLPYSGIGLLLACFGLGALLYTRLAKRIVPLLGEPRMVFAGGVLMAAALVLAVATPWWPAFILVELALGLGFFMLHGVMQARATEMLPHARATAVSAFACALFVGQSLGARGMGALIGAFDYRAAFTVEAVAVVAFGAWLGRLMRRTP